MKLTQSKHVITKVFTDYPFAHRQHKHTGHCSLIHGHNWTFEISLIADKLDENGFVFDFGRMQWVRDYFAKMFDHTLLLNKDDPRREEITSKLLNESQYFRLADIQVVADCSAEGLAKMIYDELNEKFENHTQGRVSIHSVVVREDSKNSARYYKV